MRSLALARYRFLTTVRSASGVFLTLLAGVLLPMLFGSGLFTSWSDAWASMPDDMYASARMVTIGYLLHIGFIVAACNAFGTTRPKIDGRQSADLTETVPITPRDRFLGDALGFLGCILAAHACTVPLLALVVVMSPLPTTVFFWAESVTLAVAVLGSAGASWMLRSTGQWIRTRSARSMVTFGILLVAILILNTRWLKFVENLVWWMFTQPSPQTWHGVVRTVNNPVMLAGSLLLLYFGFISYYTLQSIRSLERQ